MRKVVPYRTVEEALCALDNGGGRLDPLSRAGDGIITSSELHRAAGFSRPALLPALFLELMTSRLSDGHRAEITARLSPRLRRQCERARIRAIAPARFAAEAQPGIGYVVTGVARKARSCNGLGVYRHRYTVGAAGGEAEYKLPVLPDHEVVEIHPPTSRGAVPCGVLVRRLDSAGLRGPIEVAGVAVLYVFDTRRLRLLLVPACYVSLE